MPAILIRNLTLERNGKRIPDDVSFDVEAGEYVALVGANGAGKSTLLKCLVRLETPTPTPGFRMELDGTPLAQLSQKALARKIAYIPQVQAQAFPFTVREFVESARYAYQPALAAPWGGGSAEDREICQNALSRTGLESLASRDISTLSGGELQRVWIASALAQQSPILLLDESLSQMDYRYRMQISELLYELNREEGRTILLVSHDLNAATADAGRILALSEGKLMFDGKTSDFLCPDILRNVFGVEFQPRTCWMPQRERGGKCG